MEVDKEEVAVENLSSLPVSAKGAVRDLVEHYPCREQCSTQCVPH